MNFYLNKPNVYGLTIINLDMKYDDNINEDNVIQSINTPIKCNPFNFNKV